MSLTVQQLDSALMPSVKTTATGSSTVMEVNKSTWVFVGGLGGQVKVGIVALSERGFKWHVCLYFKFIFCLTFSQKSPAVKMTHFKGCIGEASLNEKNIGLWNYAEREGSCGGCSMRYVV